MSVPAGRVGLLAGWGRYPVIVAERLAAHGYEVYCLGVKGHADADALRPLCADFSWLGLGKLGWAVRYFAAHDVPQATFAGKIHKWQLLQPLGMVRHLPDWPTWRTFYQHLVTGRKDARDDTLLSAVIDLLESGGLRIAPATEFAPELLVRRGTLSRREPTTMQWQDIRYGWEVAKELGRFDVGQSVVVKNRTAVAVEGLEGTDRCIERAASLCGGGFTVVKVAKPQQDLRFDMPTVGRLTLETIVRGGGRCLAIEDGRTIVLDEDDLIRYANRHGVSIVAVSADDLRAAA